MQLYFNPSETLRTQECLSSFHPLFSQCHTGHDAFTCFYNGSTIIRISYEVRQLRVEILKDFPELTTVIRRSIRSIFSMYRRTPHKNSLSSRTIFLLFLIFTGAVSLSVFCKLLFIQNLRQVLSTVVRLYQIFEVGFTITLF